MAQTPNQMDIGTLYAEAKGLVRRWRGRKLSNYDALSRAVTAIDQIGLANVAAGSPEAVALLNEVEATWLYEQALGRVSKRMTYTCVALSLLVMYVVGSLYVFYNHGAALLTEMETLSAKQPDRRFGQLERQLLIARTELFSADEPCPAGVGGCTTQKMDELAQEASYTLLHELRDLSASLISLQNRVADYQKWAVSPVQIPGVGWFSAQHEANAANEPGQHGDTAAEEPPGAPPNYNDPNKPPLESLLCDPPAPDAASGRTATLAKKKHVLGMDMDAVATQACDYSVAYTSMSVPQVNVWALQVKGIIAPYAAWALPALFAWLGVLVFFLRQMVDPAEPNPTADRVLLRMALAALAGVVAGWIWEPAFGTNSEFKAAGLGLFTFAFVVGFSIEIFFTLLDRFVQISSAAIAKLGS